MASIPQQTASLDTHANTAAHASTDGGAVTARSVPFAESSPFIARLEAIQDHILEQLCYLPSYTGTTREIYWALKGGKHLPSYSEIYGTLLYMHSINLVTRDGEVWTATEAGKKASPRDWNAHRNQMIAAILAKENAPREAARKDAERTLALLDQVREESRALQNQLDALMKHINN